MEQKEIKMHPGLAESVARLQGTPYTNNLADEVVSAWMKCKKIIEDNAGESCMAAPLFIKRVFEWYNTINDDGKENYNYDGCCDSYVFRYNENTLEVVDRDATGEGLRLYQGFDIDDLICLCMGYVPNSFAQRTDLGGIVEILGIYIWHHVNTPKFQNHLKSCTARWRNTETWKTIKDCGWDFRIDLSRDREFRIETFFETYPRPLECTSHDGYHCMNVSAADEIRKIFKNNRKFFKRFDNDNEDMTISDNYYLDLWFRYVYQESLERNCYEN